MKMLKRYLMSRYNLTPADYRARWDLPADYPMVAPSYVEKRRAIAKATGIGRRPGQKVNKAGGRTEERRVGKERVRTCRSRWSLDHLQKKQKVASRNEKISL